MIGIHDHQSEEVLHHSDIDGIHKIKPKNRVFLESIRKPRLFRMFVNLIYFVTTKENETKDIIDYFN
jgi:hypothetical protein